MVSGGAVDLRDGQVTFHHVEAAVAEELLEGVRIAAVAQICDRKGVAEAVGVDVGDAGAAAEAAQVEGQMAALDGGAVGGGEERSVGRGVATDQVGPEGFAGKGLDVDDTLAAGAGVVARLPEDAEGASGLVVVGDGEAAEFAGADAGVEEDEDEGAVAAAQVGGAGVAAAGTVAVGAGLFDGAQEGVHLLTGEGLHGGGGWAGRGDLGGDVGGGVALGYGPAPEAAQGGVGVEDGFGREDGGGTRGDAGRCDP